MTSAKALCTAEDCKLIPAPPPEAKAGSGIIVVASLSLSLIPKQEVAGDV
jgi:hypothetical protein